MSFVLIVLHVDSPCIRTYCRLYRSLLRFNSTGIRALASMELQVTGMLSIKKDGGGAKTGIRFTFNVFPDTQALHYDPISDVCDTWWGHT